MLLALGLGRHAPAEAPPAATDLGYDQVIAQIPAEEAPIAPVALAHLNIALHQAKKQAVGQLCEGHWLADGEIVEEFGPSPVALADGGRAWIYEVSRTPRPLDCPRTSRADFFQAMSRYLPAWISIRPAGQTTAYAQGEALSQPHHGMASR